MTGTSTDKEFKIKFDGELNQVDANTLVSSLVNITLIVQEINEELDADKKIELKVKALDKGSFLVHIELVEAVRSVLSLLQTQYINIGTTIIGTLASLITIKQFLKGENPKEVQENGDKVILKNNKGSLKVDARTYKIFTNNVNINNAISKNFESLYADPSITAFDITDVNEKPLTHVPREDFEGMTIKSEVVEENKKTITEIATLNIFKLVFEDKYKWEFYYKGNKISAKINDTEFFANIDKGEPFAKGDSLEVELIINQVFENAANTWANQSYEINKVLKHIPRGKQQTFEFSK